MQSLREEEERIAEEDAEDDIILSYDRPELANKVILRRHSSTGMWEVCSPSKNNQCSNEMKISVSVTDTDSNDSEGSHGKEQVQEPHITNLQSQGSHNSLEGDKAKPGILNFGNFNDETLERSSRLQQCHKPAIEKNLESNYQLLLEGATSDGGSPVNCSPTSRQKSLDRDLKPPQVCLSPALACTFPPKIQSKVDHMSSNQIVESSTSKPQSDCIGFRTRQRAKSQVLTTTNSSVSSPSDKVSTVSHKYPTRHKVTGQF